MGSWSIRSMGEWKEGTGYRLENAYKECSEGVKSRNGANKLLLRDERVVVRRKDGTCRTTRSLKDSILSYARSSLL